MEDIATLCASRALGRPVKWIEDRSEHLAASTHGKETLCELEVALDADGRITGMRGRFIGNVGAFTVPGPWAMVDSVPAATVLPGAYDVREVAWTAAGVLSNKCCTAAYRGVGMTNGQAVRELLIDEAARALELDPIELRLPTSSAPSRDTYCHQHALRRRQLRTIDPESAELVDYRAFRERQAAAARARALHRRGVQRVRGADRIRCGDLDRRRHSFDILRRSQRDRPAGRHRDRTNGAAHPRARARDNLRAGRRPTQSACYENVRVVEGDTETTPYGMGTYASRSAVVGGGALIRAGTEVREKLAKLAAHMLEAAPEDIEIRTDSRASSATPRQAPGCDIAGFAYFGGPARPPTWPNRR